MDNKNIDWDENCIFEDEKVTGFKISRASNNYRTLPIPNDDKTLQEARQAAVLLDSVMQPATREQIAIAVKKLALHCGLQAKAPEDVKSMFMDYCIDLKAFPAKLINDACQEYRTMHEGNNFMPSSGKLISLMEVKLRMMKNMRNKIDKILGIRNEPSNLKQNQTISLTEALNKLIS